MSQKGFTLIEAMVAVSIVAVLVVIAIPNYLQQMANQRLKDDVTNIKGGVQIARSVAMVMSAQTAMQIIKTTSDQFTYRVFLDSGLGGGTPNDGIWNGCETLIGPSGQPVVSTDCPPAQGINNLSGGVTLPSLAAVGDSFSVGFAPSGRRTLPVGTGLATITLQNDFNLTRLINVTSTGEAEVL